MRKSPGKRLQWVSFIVLLFILLAVSSTIPKLQMTRQALADGGENLTTPPTALPTDAPPADNPPADIPPGDPPPADTLPTDTPPTEEIVTEAPPTQESAPENPPAEATADVVIPAEESTDEPPLPEGTPEVTATVAPPAVESTPEVGLPEDTPTEEAMMSVSGAEDMMAMAALACQLDINDAGDANPFTFNFAAINTEGMSTYEWNFGDTTTATGQSVSHTYTGVGAFTVTLTCIPDSGTNIVLTGSVSISSTVTANFTVSPATTGFAPYTVNLTNLSTGGGLTFTWTVTGPGGYTNSSSDTNPSFTFPDPGTYTITLTARDGANQTNSRVVDVIVQYPPPVVDFTLSQTSGSPPLLVHVEGVNTGGPVTTWTWDFGDGSPTVTGQIPPDHTYTAEGTYWIVLTYTGPGGNGTVSKQVGVYATGDEIEATFTYSLQGNVPGGIKVCFTNTSTGPVVTNTWNFGDGTIIVDNSATVCHVYATANNFEVFLRASAADPDIFSDANQIISVVAAPQAQIVASATSILWAGTVDFDGDSLSTGENAWEWDFNNDGAYEVTGPTPTGIQFNTMGSIPVRLRVTGPGGQATAEMIIQVALRPIACDFTGALSAVPGQTTSLDGTVTDVMGRTITYTWTITGPAALGPYNTQDIASITWPSEGTYLVTFAASAPDSANCSQSKTVQVAYPPLTCNLTGNLNPAPNGNNITYTANVNGLEGRPVTYTWYVNGVAQPGNSSTFVRSWSSPTTETISYDATLANGTGCNDSETVVVSWPNLTCSIAVSSGGNNPIPALPDNPTRSYTYTGNVNGLAGRTATYAWYVDGVLQASTTNTLVLSWAWNEEGPKVITYNVVSSVTGSNCTSVASRTVTVSVPALNCSVAGDLLPVLNETVTYSLNLTNRYGRTITSRTWDLQESNGAGGWNSVASGTDPTITYTFDQPGKTYRLYYTLDVTQPDHDCDSYVTITSAGTGVDFICDSLPTGTLSPANAGASYTYEIQIDNTRGFELEYTWVLVDHTGAERVLDTNTSTFDGWVSSPAIPGTALGPADNYTLRVDVKAVDPLQTPHSCSRQVGLTVGTLNIDFTYTGSASAIEVGYNICLTNTSSTSHDPISALTYNWDFGTADNSLGSQVSTAEQPGCISFPNPGTYTIKLTGTNQSGLRAANKQVTFNVYGSQSIAIDHSDVTFAPANNMSFSAIAVNLNAPYTWTFRNLDTGTVLGTRTGQNVNFDFADEGKYEAVVSATGPLGTTTATSQFELLAIDDIRAAFRPSAFGGVAPMQVCFTDRSVGDNRNSWTWDFGNGQTLTYNDTNIPASICADYTTPATAYTVRLTVTNTSGRTASAQNVIRTFNLVEAEATFTIQPQGNGRFCFQALIDPGISVVAWKFGDGSMGGAQEYVCYVYQSSGSYLVTMYITDGTTDGEITRPVDVDLTSTEPPPALAVTHACNADGSITFTVTNNGGDMTTPDRVTLRNASNVLIQSDDYLLLDNGESKTYTVTGYYDTVYLSTLDTSAAHSGDCNEPPMLSGSISCQADGTAVFTVTNSSADTAANQPYEIRDAANGLVQSGTVTAAANGGTQQFTVTGRYEPLTFTTDGGAQGATTIVSLNSNCDQPPVLSVVVSCQADGTAVFTVTNISVDTAANQPYEIRDAANGLVQSGTVTAAVNGGTQQFTVTGRYDPLTFNSNGGAQGATTVMSAANDCDEPPVLAGSASCAADGTAVFVVLNSSANTAASQPYQVLDASNNVVDSGTITASANGGLQEIRVSGRFEPLTFSTSGGAQGATTVVSLNTNCPEPPVLSVVTACLIDGTAVFTITNDSAHTAANQAYEIRDAASTLVQSGTITAAINGGTQIIQVMGVYHNLTLTSTLADVPSAQITADTNCFEPPMLAGTVGCQADSTAVFRITNTSVDTDASQPYEIRTGGTLVQSGMLDVLANGGVMIISVSGVYTPLTFSSVGPQGVTTELSLTNRCDPPPQAAAFVLTPTPVPTDLPLPPAGGTGTGGINGARAFFPAMDLTPGALDPSLPRSEPWAGIHIGARVCETWILYHTDMTGDWEVFRLGDLPKYPAAHPNLSMGEGVDVIDRAPTRSPDAEWIAFTSNRDGNWEIYFSKVDNSEIRRVTYNTRAKDIDPTWSPDGRYVAFESDRDGNWELYLLEVGTGVEYRITDNPASDINAYWSDDSTKLVFQSNRDGLWQIYEIDLANQVERRLSDGTGNDHDPAYSFKGDRVAFRSYRDNNPNSVLYVMDADGSDVTRISDPNGDAYNQTWYIDDSIIAYQSDLDGDSDIYVYQFADDVTRLVTDNTIEDYAPTWLCNSPIVVFTSDVTDDPNIYNTPALPIEAPPILVDEEGSQMTFDTANDIYPENAPTEENASREGEVPPEFNTGGI